MTSISKKQKRGLALVLAAVIILGILIPQIVRAYSLTQDDYKTEYTAPSWTVNPKDYNVKKTGLAFNWTPYNKNPNAGNLFPFSAAAYLSARPGYLEEEFKDFDDRFIYCVASHTPNYRLNPGTQAFRKGVYKTEYPFPEANHGADPEFNFLMLAIACSYPSQKYDPSSMSSVPYSLVCQAIAWLCTDEDRAGFGQDSNKIKTEEDFRHDLQYYRSSNVYQALTDSFPMSVAPEIYKALHAAPPASSAAAQAGMANMMDAYFYDIWHAAALSKQLEKDWDQGITSTTTVMEQKDGEYHVYLDLFVNDSAQIYLNGISFVPHGDWLYLGPDPETGKQHFKSASGELDTNGSIGYLTWNEDKIGALMPQDISRAKLFTFVFYNDTLANPGQFGMGNSQTYFSSILDSGLNLYVTIADEATDSGDSNVKVDRFEHEENFQAAYNVNLIKYDSETGKPLADSHWDILEKFDDSQLASTDLDRKPNNLGEYSSGLGKLINTEWGDDDIYSNYSGNVGVTQSDTNKYNWKNDNGTQFERWDDPQDDPCDRDDNSTAEDGVLHEINSAGNTTDTIAHTDRKRYGYHKGYCTGHPAPQIDYIECDHEEDEECDCEEINQKIHDEAWEAWYAEVEKCEHLVEEGGFFHCIEPGDAAKKAMEADRDEFFEDFISLTYDYSAEEIRAPKGYILHGIHTDDTPVEWRTVSSSEYKDTDRAANISHSGRSSDERIDRNEEKRNDTESGYQYKPSIDQILIEKWKMPAEKEPMKENLEETEAKVSISKPEESESGEDESESVRETEPEKESSKEEDLTDLEMVKAASTLATPSEPINDEENGIFGDYELTEDDGLQSDKKATNSNAEPAERAATGYRMPTKDPKDGGRSLRGSERFRQSTANTVVPPNSSIIDWTFIAYDHRTEGEIHFNKRDFDLSNDTGDSYDDYGQENADGTLEGAVYGLFAAQDIIHPDTDGGLTEYNTGVVYKKDNLVSVAATDRNGDGSFMAITQAPGYTYDYEKGAIVKTPDGWADQAPKNLHTNQSDGDIKEDDAERFVGHTPSNEEIAITDSQAGDGAYYGKLSSNQGIEDTWRESDTTGYTPIHNNEDNNGNCWIGRPLLLGKDGTSYYIKELSRSEGYELSVYGKDNRLMTNREAFEQGGNDFSTGSAAASPITDDKADGGNTFTVTSDGTKNGYIVKTVNVPEGAAFHITSSEYVWDDAVTHQEEVKKEVPVYATEGDFVMIGGKTWEAQIGDNIQYNGKTFPVQNIKTILNDKQGVKPDNSMVINHPHLDSSGMQESGNVMGDINKLFLSNGFRSVEHGAPWISLEIPSFDLNAVADTINRRLFADDYYKVFNALQMLGSYEQNGKLYVAIGYCGRDSRSNAALYNEANDTIYVKTDITYQAPSGDDMKGFIYRTYPTSACENVQTNDKGFVTFAIVPNEIAIGRPDYVRCILSEHVTFQMRENETYWAYAAGDNLLTVDGEPAAKIVTELIDVSPTLVKKVKNEQIPYDTYEETIDGAGTYTLTLSQEKLDSIKEPGVDFRILYDKPTVVIDGKERHAQKYAVDHGIIGITFPMGNADSYIETILLMYPGGDTIVSHGGTQQTPAQLYERPIRQKIKVNKDIQTLQEAKQVWYCLNCGYENGIGLDVCEHCRRKRTTEETKTVQYSHDTYSAVHSENIFSGRNDGIYETAKDWLAKLLGEEIEDEEAKTIPHFRFKAYLKSNLERLYRDRDGNIVWLDRNGNIMVPQYQDTNGDGNYDTFTWKYANGKETDFPEKDKITDEGILESSNVQKIYTKIEHNKDSMTTSAQANNVWDGYDTPQGGATSNVGEKGGFSTSQRETADGAAGDLSGKAVNSSAVLYSYRGKNINTEQTDRINEDSNAGYSRLLETRWVPMGDGAGADRQAERYNYEKFFDSITAANTDIWDNDMHTTYTGTSMGNYPGQHWYQTFYEAYQKDDADPDHTLENTDGADKDDTAGGDRDTSFKPFRWIREHVFGNRADYESYPADHGGANTEVLTSTSDFARANAEASDAVRQFAVKWYLEDEAAKLMAGNGVGEDIAKDSGGTLPYEEAVYDEALFRAIAKTYNYLKPFYANDLDTIYSVEWDSAENGGTDKDYTSLSIDIKDGDEHYNMSSYLPYGVYVVVEQQPGRRDGAVNDWENRSYTIETPKEVIVPSLYDTVQANDTADNYDRHYSYQYGMTAQEQAGKENYLIRFGEEWTHNNPQDEREYVIRAHGCQGDYEIYKYGLDIDRLTGTIGYDGGSYAYAGWKSTQDMFDPLKDYYDTEHKGKSGLESIGTEYGGNDASDYMAVHKADGLRTANGSSYDAKILQNRFFYGSISEDAGIVDQVMFKESDVAGSNASGRRWEDGIRSMTGELTAYEGMYAPMLVPWTVTVPADLKQYSSADFTGCTDVNVQDGYYTVRLRINKADSETGEYILHDNAIFALYAGSRYNTFEEIKKDAKLILDDAERERFLTQFKLGDAKFYLKDTTIQGTREFLMAMGAMDITPAVKGKSVVESAAGPGESCSGWVKKGTPVCVESEKIILTDETGGRTGQMTVYTTLNDILAAGDEEPADKIYANQNTGYFTTPQPIGAGVYVLAELKAPAGYARSNPIPFEVYSDKTQYYVDGDMYNKVSAVRYDGNLPNAVE